MKKYYYNGCLCYFPADNVPEGAVEYVEAKAEAKVETKAAEAPKNKAVAPANKAKKVSKTK
jgi:hypothetical protein